MNATRAYLDHNASAPLLPAARAAMLAALDAGGNASSVHAEGRAARRIVEAARREVAALAGARPEHVIFTSGATEAASTLLTPEWRMGRAPLKASRLLVAATEHPCILGGGQFAADAKHVIRVDRRGIVDLDALAVALAAHDRGEGVALVAIQAANNETGVLQPLGDVAAITKAAGAVLIVDAVQAAGRIPVEPGLADFLILSSHKIGGPQGAGAIVAGSDLLMPRPLLSGGGQEEGHRAGTENVAAIAGFGAAAAAAALGRMADVRRMRDDIEAAIMETAPGSTIFAAGAPRLPNTVFFALDSAKAETAQIAFDLAGVAVSAGSACSSGRVGPSHVLRAMGYGDEAAGLRVSIGWNTTREDIDRFIGALRQIVERQTRKKAIAA